METTFSLDTELKAIENYVKKVQLVNDLADSWYYEKMGEVVKQGCFFTDDNDYLGLSSKPVTVSV